MKVKGMKRTLKEKIINFYRMKFKLKTNKIVKYYKILKIKLI